MIIFVFIQASVVLTLYICVSLLKDTRVYTRYIYIYIYNIKYITCTQKIFTHQKLISNEKLITNLILPGV